MRKGILVSGDLGYKVLLELFREKQKPFFLATDSNSYKIKNLAKKHNIPIFIGNPRNGKLINFLIDNNIKTDLVLSINYLFLLDNEIIDFLPIAVNFHGSLLPKYRGRTPHIWAIINGEIETGITAHIIDYGCDTGHIIKQSLIPINFDDTGKSILNKFYKIYPELILKVIEEIRTGQLKKIKQDDNKSTYFRRRTADDGLINWNWQKDRIRNWVRAQTYPYPGAFSFLNGEKIIIDEIKFSNVGFRCSIPNGMVLNTTINPIIKCPNGAIELTRIRNKEILNKIIPRVILL